MARWLVFAVLSVVAAAFIVWPFLRQRKTSPPRGALDLAIYRSQLRELSRDRENGLLSEGNLAAAEAEIGRRMLRAADESTATADRPLEGGGRRLSPRLAILVAFAAVSVALTIYLAIGRPGVLDQPLAARKA